MSAFSRLARAALPVLLVVALGCGSPAPPRALTPVKGKVWLENEPLTAGIIIFHPADSRALPPTATIQPDGSFELMSGVQPGATPGKYKVVVVVIGAARGKTRIPAKYGDPTTTDLVVEVGDDAPAERYQLLLRK